jgi:hypothetical protein
MKFYPNFVEISMSKSEFRFGFRFWTLTFDEIGIPTKFQPNFIKILMPKSKFRWICGVSWNVRKCVEFATAAAPGSKNDAALASATQIKPQLTISSRSNFLFWIEICHWNYTPFVYTYGWFIFFFKVVLTCFEGHPIIKFHALLRSSAEVCDRERGGGRCWLIVYYICRFS